MSPKYPGFVPLGFEDDSAHSRRGHFERPGLQLVVAAPGAGQAAILDFLAGFYVGRLAYPFGAALSPADVLVVSQTLADSAFLGRYVPYEGQVCGSVHVKRPRRRFNWRIPGKVLEALDGAAPGQVSALIIDAGPLAKSVDDEIVQSAQVEMEEKARSKRCSITVIVESLSNSNNPFERIPQPLRQLRDPLLVCPLRPKALGATASEFMLLRLEHRTPTALCIRFSLLPPLDHERPQIFWGALDLVDPRRALLQAEIDDLRGALLCAAEVALRLLEARPYMSSEELQAIGFLQNGIPKSTMSAALTAARAAGYAVLWDGSKKKNWTLPGAPPPWQGCVIVPSIKVPRQR